MFFKSFQIINKCVIALAIVLLMTQTVFADTTVNLSGSHVIKNNESLKSGRHTFVLTAIDNAPMPADAQGSVKKVTIDSGEDFQFGDITFSKPGFYKYQVSREIYKSDELEQDDSVYNVTVTVFNNDEKTVVFEKVGSEGKPDKILYEDTYIKKTSKKVKTGDNPYNIVYLAMFGASVLVALIILAKKNKNR